MPASSQAAGEKGGVLISPYSHTRGLTFELTKICYVVTDILSNKPIESTQQIFLDSKGKVHSNLKINNYDVDPVTLEKIPEKVSPVKTVERRENREFTGRRVEVLPCLFESNFADLTCIIHHTIVLV